MDGRDRLVFLIDDQQQKEVALAAAAETRAHVVVLQARVDAHEEDRFQPVAVLIGLAVLLQRRRFFKAIGEIAAHRARQSAAAQQRKTERHERQCAEKTGQIALRFHLFSMPPCATHFCVIDCRFASMRRPRTKSPAAARRRHKRHFLHYTRKTRTAPGTAQNAKKNRWEMEH